MEFQELLSLIKKDNPNLNFEASSHFSWNNSSQTVNFTHHLTERDTSRFNTQLLHELAHAKLQHHQYQSDVELLKIESETWSLTEKLAHDYKIKLSQKEISEAMQSYINWASSRSKCPKCHKNGLQIKQTAFICPNCSTEWQVSKSRFKRTYRQAK